MKGESIEPDALRIFWSWSATGNWQAPDNPRLAFARHSVLFKLYIQHQLVSDADPNEEGRSDDFIRLFVEELNRLLFVAS